MKIKTEDAKELFWEDDTDDYIWVETTPFVSYGKWECADCVFQYGDKHYMFSVSRSGSYYSDYVYIWTLDDVDEIECKEVVKQEIVIEKWVEV